MTLRPARTIAWWFWLLGQAGVLCVYAAGVPLSGGYPTPVETTAPIGLAVGQLVFGVLLAPVLLTDRRTIFSAIWVGVLCHAIAGRLAGTSAVEILPLAATVALWLAVAGLLSRWALGQLALFFATFAGPVLFYVRLEYHHASTSPHFWAWAWSPTVGICSTGPHQPAWATLIVGFAMLLTVLTSRSIENRLTAKRVDAIR